MIAGDAGDGATGGESGDPEGDGSATDDGYGGVLGTYPYAFRHSESRLFRSYVALGGLLTALIAVAFLFSFVGVVASTLGGSGGTFTFARSFVVVVGLVVVVPLMAPVVLVARRHRRADSTREYDRALAAGGYLFAVSLYLTLIVTAPPELRDEPTGALAPVLEFLYGLPDAAGAVPPLAAVAVGYLLHRRYR